MMTREPISTIPEPMRGLEADTWANSTIRIRFGNTVRRVLAENDFPVGIITRLKGLIADIPDALIRPLGDPNAPDLEDWNAYIEPYLGMNWLEPPWFFSEHYFYRRIIEAIGYFQEGWDPFAISKQRGLEHGPGSISGLASRLEDWLNSNHPTQEILLSLLYLDLWGNQADYSLWPADAEGASKPDHADLSQANDYLLTDAAPEIVEYLLALNGKHARVDFMIDNAGLELVSDLVFADYLLSAGVVEEVRFHLKAHPTFVSDALPKDVIATIAHLESTDEPFVRDLGKRLSTHLQENRLTLRSDFFWNSPLDGWKMREDLIEELSRSNLVISKGDANYRRLLGDQHWPFTTPFADIVAYFPAPLAALRTLKSELVCGLSPAQAETVAAKDPEWLVNGRWGLIQFLSP